MEAAECKAELAELGQNIDVAEICAAMVIYQ